MIIDNHPQFSENQDNNNDSNFNKNNDINYK